MPTDHCYCRPKPKGWTKLRRGWERWYLAQGVSGMRAPSLARVKADKGRPVPAFQN